MTRKPWNGSALLMSERVSFKIALPVFILLLSFLFNNDLFAKERDQEMGIVLVAVGEIDRNIMDRLKNDLNKLFKKPIVIGKGCLSRIMPITKKETSTYLLRY